MALNIRDRIKELRRVPANQLRPNPKNWRTHPVSQINALKGVLAEVGYAAPALARELPDGSLMLIDGHARSEVSGDNLIPVAVLDVTEEETDKLLATFDPLGDMAGADAEKLDELLKSIEMHSPAVNAMLEELAKDSGCASAEPGEIVEDEVPEPPEEPITKPGDLWILGEHRLLCGDSTKAEDVGRLMGGEIIETVVSDPPYGVDWCGDYTRFSKGGVAECSRQYKPIVGDSKEFDPRPWIGFKTVLLWGGNLFAKHLPIGSWLVWDKRSSDGTAFLADGEIAWLNKGYGVYLKSVNAQSEKATAESRETRHPTKKPVSIMAWSIEQTKSNGAIIDPFLGSGTTLVAAEQLGRKCYGMEISPAYCDVIVKRWENLTGKKAVLETSQQEGGNG